MNKKTMAVPMALCLLAMSVAPLGSADPCDESGADCYKKTATGPGSALVKGVAGGGLAFCLAPGLPLPCLAGGGGGVFFNITEYNQGSGFNTGLNIDVWAEFIGGGVTNPDVALDGFRMTVCADRDLSGVCTPNVGSEDDYVTTFATSPEEDCDSAKGGAASKDDKCSEDGTVDAWIQMCVNKDLAFDNPEPLEDIPEAWSTIVVFIGAYADSANLTNLGLSVGQFDVYLSVDPVSVESCPETPTRLNART